MRSTSVPGEEPRSAAIRVSRPGSPHQLPSRDWLLSCRLILALGFIGMAVGSMIAPSTGVAQFSVSPVITTLPIHGGDQPVSGLVSVRNESETTKQFLLSIVDFDQSPDGDHSYSSPGTLHGSCGDRVEVTPVALSIGAGEVEDFRIEIPAGAPERSCWFMVFVESPAASESGVIINQRIGVKVFGIGASTMPGGEIRTASLDESGETRTVSLEYENPGDAPAWPIGALEVRDYRGAVVAATPVRQFTVLPRSSRRIVVELPHDLESGRYLAVPMLDFGGAYLAGTQLPFRVP